MEEISSEQNHVDVSFSGQAHDFIESLPTVVAPDRVAFVVADMIVCGDEDTDRIRCLLKSVDCQSASGNWCLQVEDGIVVCRSSVKLARESGVVITAW